MTSATTDAIRSSTFSVPKEADGEPLSQCVRRAVDNYFEHLDGHDADGLYELVIREVEKPLLESVMMQTRGNQSRAAQVLGMSRSTLRKKLKIHSIE